MKNPAIGFESMECVSLAGMGKKGIEQNCITKSIKKNNLTD
jgi:hypothetical protein